MPTSYMSFPTKQDGVIWSHDIESKLDRGIVSDITKSRRITMSGLFERHRTEVTPTNRNARSEGYMLNMFNECLGCNTLCILIRDVVSEFRDARFAKCK